MGKKTGPCTFEKVIVAVKPSGVLKIFEAPFEIVKPFQVKPPYYSFLSYRYRHLQTDRKGFLLTTRKINNAAIILFMVVARRVVKIIQSRQFYKEKLVSTPEKAQKIQ
ncbi:MAG: hypothetical protein WDO71_08630 [Bacteroidota bacterium]